MAVIPGRPGQDPPDLFGWLVALLWFVTVQTIQYFIPAAENIHKILIQHKMGNSLFPFPLDYSSMPLGQAWTPFLESPEQVVNGNLVVIYKLLPKSKSPEALSAWTQLRLNPAGGWMVNLSKGFVHVFLIWLQAVALDIQHLLWLLWGGISA